MKKPKPMQKFTLRDLQKLHPEAFDAWLRDIIDNCEDEFWFGLDGKELHATHDNNLDPLYEAEWTDKNGWQEAEPTDDDE